LPQFSIAAITAELYGFGAILLRHDYATSP
jgi:hypothetical protein